MPIGRVKWFDEERGFGFASNPDGEDVYLSRQVLPKGTTTLHQGQRIEFDYSTGRRGPQALRVTLIDAPRAPKAHTSKARTRRYTPEELNSMISDLFSLMESRVQPDLQRGRFPERKVGRQVAEILRVVAKELDA